MNQSNSTADFQVDIVDDVIVIFDLDTGHGVTSDIQTVLNVIDAQMGGIGERTVIYRDSSKTFDGVYHRGDQFGGFFPLGEQVLERAVSKARGYNVVPLRAARW